jgi:hypothetical protein
MWNNLKALFFIIPVVPLVVVLMLTLFMIMVLAFVFLAGEQLEMFKVALKHDLNKAIG